MMTQKHFTAIAEIIHSERDEIMAEQARANDPTSTAFAIGKAHGTMILANRLANYFATDNANFKRGKFLAACGMQS